MLQWLFLVLVFASVTESLAVLTTREKELWNSYFEKGGPADLFNMDDEQMTRPIELKCADYARLNEPIQSSSATLDLLQRHVFSNPMDYGIRIKTLGFERAVLLYQGISLTDHNCGEETALLKPPGLPWCRDIDSTMDQVTTPYLMKNNYTDLMLRATTINKDSNLYPAYNISYMLYNSACAEIDSDPLMLPTILTSSPDFPFAEHVRTINEQCEPRRLNVRLYTSITVTVKMSDVQQLDCDTVYISIGDTKFCHYNNYTQVIDVASVDEINVVSQAYEDYNGVGFVLHIQGHKDDGEGTGISICESNAILSYDQMTILSPNYPYSIKQELYCNMAISRFDKLEYQVSSLGTAGAGDCAPDSYLSIGNSRLCGNLTFSNTMFMKNDLEIEYTNTAGVAFSPFRISYKAYNYINICSLNKKNITSLPLRLKSPNFPASDYPENTHCMVFLRTGLRNITVDLEYLSVETSQSCLNDYLAIGLQATHYCKPSDAGIYYLNNSPSSLPALQLIRFWADHRWSGGGFALTISETLPPTTTSKPTTPTRKSTTTSPNPSPPNTSKPNTFKPGTSSPNTIKPDTSKGQNSTPKPSGTTNELLSSLTPDITTNNLPEATTLPEKGGKSKHQSNESDKEKSGGLPAYGAALIGVLAVVIVVAAIVTVLIMRRRRLRYRSMSLQGLHNAFDNPLYGEESSAH